jgi:TetR/AcrR family transcriptional repressor of nem operon
VVPQDPDIREAVATLLRRMEDFFRRCAERGQADGTITNRHSADDLARHLLATMMGIRVLARVRPDREVLEGALAPALRLLDPES